MTNPTPLTKEQEEIVVAFMTDLQEKLSDILQPMLEIAEGKRSIDEWNDYAEKLLIVAENHEAQSIKQERSRVVELLETSLELNKLSPSLFPRYIKGLLKMLESES